MKDKKTIILYTGIALLLLLIICGLILFIGKKEKNENVLVIGQTRTPVTSNATDTENYASDEENVEEIYNFNNEISQNDGSILTNDKAKTEETKEITKEDNKKTEETVKTTTNESSKKTETTVKKENTSTIKKENTGNTTAGRTNDSSATQNNGVETTKNETSKVKYKVTFQYDNPNEKDIIQTVTSGNYVNAPKTIYKNGYTFSGWYNGDTKVTFPIKVTKDITLKAHYKMIDLKGDVNADGKVNNNDVTKLLEYVKSGKVEILDELQKNADVDLDGYITYNDLNVLENYLSGEKIVLGNPANQIQRTLLGDYNLDGILTMEDHEQFKQYLNNHSNTNKKLAYIKQNMDLLDDGTIDYNDLNVLKILIQNDFTMVSGRELQTLKKENNINTDSYVIAFKTTENVTEEKFNIYYVLNCKTSYNEIDHMKEFLQKNLEQVLKIDNRILKMLKENNTDIIVLGSWDCDNGMKNVGHFTYAAYYNTKNRNILIGYNYNNINNEFYIKSIIHEFGHAFDFTLRFLIMNKTGSPITGLWDSSIINGSERLKKLFLFNNADPYNWKELAEAEAESLKTNFNSFSPYSLNDLIARPYEYFGEVFKHYFYSEESRSRIQQIAPYTFNALEKMISGYFE